MPTLPFHPVTQQYSNIWPQISGHPVLQWHQWWWPVSPKLSRVSLLTELWTPPVAVEPAPVNMTTVITSVAVECCVTLTGIFLYFEIFSPNCHCYSSKYKIWNVSSWSSYVYIPAIKPGDAFIVSESEMTNYDVAATVTYCTILLKIIAAVPLEQSTFQIICSVYVTLLLSWFQLLKIRTLHSISSLP